MAITMQVSHEGIALNVLIMTQDLELRSVSEKDKPNYQTLYSDPNTMKMFTDNEQRLTDKGLEEWKAEQVASIAKRVDLWVQRWKDGIPFGAFAIYHGEEFVGHIIAGFGDSPGESEIAYIIRHQDWNKKFGSQAVEAVVQKWIPYIQSKGFVLDGKAISILTATSRLDNDPSIKILLKNGFVKVSEKEAWRCTRGVYQKTLP